MKKFIAVLATVGMVAALAAGCGSGDDTSADKGTKDRKVRPVTGILPMISQSYPEKMDLEQEELS